MRRNLDHRPIPKLLVSLSLWMVLSFLGVSCISPAVTDTPRAGIRVIRPPGDIDALVLRDDVIWGGGRSGITCLNLQGQDIGVPFQGDASFEYVKALCSDSQGRVWIAHEKGLACYDGTDLVSWTAAEGLPDNRVNTVIEDSAGRIWIGTWNGVLVLDGDQRQHLTEADGLLNNMVNIILEARNGDIWFGSYAVPAGGISIRSGSGWQYFDSKNGLPNNNVTSLMQDAAGQIWAGTGFYDLGGACWFVQDAGRWRLAGILTESDGLTGAKVRSVFQAADGAIWLGSEYDGATILRDGEMTVVTTADGLSDNEIKSLLQDEAGRIWIGTRDGITLVNPAEFP